MSNLRLSEIRPNTIDLCYIDEAATDDALTVYNKARVLAGEGLLTVRLPLHQKPYEDFVRQAYHDAGVIEPPCIEYVIYKTTNKNRLLKVGVAIGSLLTTFAVLAPNQDSTTSLIQHDTGGVVVTDTTSHRSWCDHIYHRNVSCELRPLVDSLEIVSSNNANPQDEVSLEEFVEDNGDLSDQAIPENELTKILRPQAIIDEEIAHHKKWCDSIDNQNVGCVHPLDSVQDPGIGNL